MKIFAQNIINLYSEKGKQWLDDLPKLVAKVKEDGCDDSYFKSLTEFFEGTIDVQNEDY